LPNPPRQSAPNPVPPQQGAVTRQPLIGQFAQPHTGRRKKGKGTGTPGAARRSEQPDTTPPSAGVQPLPSTTPQATPSLPPARHPLPSHNQDGELRTAGRIRHPPHGARGASELPLLLGAVRPHPLLPPTDRTTTSPRPSTTP
ncbi:hypothetical protein CLOP_g739, partial [Closterium sp. NIES-67]